MSFPVYSSLELPVRVLRGTLTNNGPGTLYYRDRSPVSSGTNDGSLASGAAVVLDGQFWIIASTGGAASVQNNVSALANGRPLSESVASVATTSTSVVIENLDRSMLVLTNASDTGIWFRRAASGAAVGVGDFLAANGGSNGGEEYTGPVCAVHIGASGTKALAATEF